jgi:magnesium transporter
MYQTKAPMPESKPIGWGKESGAPMDKKRSFDGEPLRNVGEEIKHPVDAAHQQKPVITLMQYDAGSLHESQYESVEEVFVCRDNPQTSWINIDGLGDEDALRKLASHFNLHPLAMEDVMHTDQRPKAEEYPGHLFIVAQMVYLGKERCIQGEQVSIFLGKNCVITIQEESEYDVFDSVRARVRRDGSMVRQSGADFLAAALLDAVIDQYFPVLETMGEAIEDFEEQVLRHATRQSLHHLHGFKRTLLQLRRSAWPQREVLGSLSRDESGLISDKTKPYLRDVYDHTIQLMDMIESDRDVLAGLMDLYVSSLSIRTNEIMRVLTVVSSVFIPLTFIAGVYGMNFDTSAGPTNMPELHSPHGYVICWAVMLAIAIGQLVFFYRKGWLRKY